MFEIPDDDGFWDDFTLEDDKNVAQNKTANSPAASTSCLLGAEQSTPAENSKRDRFSLDDSNSKFGVKSYAGASSTSDKPILPGRRKYERKFPGPAGLLPAMPTNGHVNSPGLEVVGTAPDPLSKCTNNEEAFDLPTSQAQVDDVGSLPHWKKMLEDLGPDAQTFLSKFSIKALLLRASRKMLNKGKAPLVFGMMENLDMQGPDASFVIRDETGKMKGSLHKDLIQDPGTALHAGCALILRQVSVISPSSRTHYLNVTPGNVVFIYSSDQDAAVKKRSWPSSPVPAANPESSHKDCVGSPSLQEIIQESEQELSLSLRNFHNNRSNRMTTRISGAPSIPRATRQPGLNLSSPPLFTSNSTQSPGPLGGLHTTLSRPVGNAGSLRGLSAPMGYRPAPRLPNACLSESPLPPSLGLGQLLRQQVPYSTATKRVQNGMAEASAHMISGDVAVRQSNKQIPGHSARPVENPLRAVSQICDKNSSSRLDNFSFDFPEDNADRELLQLCDETLTDTESGKQSNDPSVKNNFGLDDRLDIPSPPRVTSNVISEVFRDCLHENSVSNRNNSGLKREANSNTGFQVKPALGRTFTFKRKSPTMSGPNSSFGSLKRICVVDEPPLRPETEPNHHWRLGVFENRNTFTSNEKVTPSMIGNEHVAKRNESGERDSRIQLGQRTAPAQMPVSHVTDALGSWDDDLTEDLLLSQLSEEF